MTEAPILIAPGPPQPNTRGLGAGIVLALM
jgi:hypothetical protein